MTPLELLDAVKLRFTRLLHDNDEQLEALLVTALRAYQDRAAYITRMRITKDDGLSINVPDDYLELVAVNDATGDWVYCDVVDNKIEIENSWGMRWPLTIEYLMDLTSIDLNAGMVPKTIVGIIQDYLEALIAIPNTDRLRRVSIAQKLDMSNLSDEAALYQRKVDIEDKMASRGAIPRASVIYSAIGKNDYGHY